MCKLLSVVIFSFIMFAYITYVILEYPYVYISNSSKKCIRVVISGEIVEGGCKELPEKYFIVNIK